MHILSRSVLVRTAGASTRLAAFTVAAISAAMIVLDPGFLGYVPKYVLGGLLILLGWGLLYQWLIQSWRQLPLLEYLSLLAIALLIINWGFVAGVLIGVVIGCATFALSASRVNAIKFGFDSTEYRSALDRGPHSEPRCAIMAGKFRAWRCKVICSSVRPTVSFSTSKLCPVDNRTAGS